MIQRLGRLRAAPLASLGAGVTLILLAVLPPGNYSIDGTSMVTMAESIGLEGNLSVSCDVGVPGRDGECYSRWYPLLSIISVPFVLLGQAIGELVSIPPAYPGRVMALVVPALSLAGAAVLTGLLARDLGAGHRASVAAGCALAFCTEALTFGRTGYAETLGAFLVALGAWGFAGEGRRRWVGVAAVSLAVLAKPQLVVVGPAIGLAFALRGGSWKPALQGAGGAGLGGLVFLSYNWLRFESVWDFGGPGRTIGGSSPSGIVEGLGVLLVSPGRGLFVFSPIVILGAWALWKHRGSGLAAAGLAVTGALLLVYSTKPGVFEGWGTRYLVPALPLLCAGLGVLKRTQMRVAMALALVGLLIQLPTLLAPYERINAERLAQGMPVQEYWNPAKSAAVAQWPAALRQVRQATRSDPGRLVDEAGRSGGESTADQGLLQVVFMWWWMLPAAGLPRALGLAASLCLLLLGLGLLATAAGVRLGRRPSVTADTEGVSAGDHFVRAGEG